MYKYVMFSVLFTLLTSCSSTVSNITTDKDKNLETNTGYLLIGVETNADLEEILLDGTKFIRLTNADLKEGTQYILVDVPSGEYAITKIKSHATWQLKLTEGYWNFEVSDGVINYVGHIDIERYGWFRPSYRVALQNRSSAAYAFMEELYPNILGNRQIIYGGPGEDPFLEYVKGADPK